GGGVRGLRRRGECGRLVPGVVGRWASPGEESLEEGPLKYPQYPRPPVFEGEPIPEVLTSGDHNKVRAWRRAEAERLTAERRPDLWALYQARKVSKNLPESKG